MRKTKLLQVVTVLIISISNAHSKGMNTVNSPSLIFVLDYLAPSSDLLQSLRFVINSA